MTNKCTHEFHTERKLYEKNHIRLESKIWNSCPNYSPQYITNPSKHHFQSECQEADTDSKLQHFIAALAKVRFLKLVKIGRHFCMKCYNFTSLSSYMQKPKPVVKRILEELEKRISSNIQMGSLTQ